MNHAMVTSATSRPAFAGTSTWSVYVPSSVHAKPRDGPTMASTSPMASMAGTYTGRSPLIVPDGPAPAVKPDWMLLYSGAFVPSAFASMNMATPVLDSQRVSGGTPT